MTANLSALSTALYTLTPNNNPSSFIGTDPNNATFKARDTGAGFAVINVTAAQLASAANFIYDIAPVSGGFLTTIINVTGATSYTLNANSNNSAYNSYVLWNFGNATSITLNKQFNGGLLAPLASISNSTAIEGSIAVANFSQGGEVHLGTFLGNSKLVAALTPSGGTVGAVPEPATWGMMVAGFGLIGVARRRRGATAVAA